MPGIVTELTPAVQTRCRGTRIFLSYALASHFSAPSGHLANCNAMQKVRALPNLFQGENPAITFVLRLKFRGEEFR